MTLEVDGVTHRYDGTSGPDDPAADGSARSEGSGTGRDRSRGEGTITAGGPALSDVSLSVDAGELVAVLGPSGCGKTTLVGVVAGHLAPTAGRVSLRGEDVTALPPEDRRVGVVFQESTLFPHMTVAENVAYGLRGRGVDPDRHAPVVDRYLELVEIEGRRDATPGELSGGQRRRVELARALAPEPDVLLLDEPLSALDRNLRVRLREEVRRIQRETGVATLYVTHDQDDATALADRIAVLNGGEVVGTGTPRDLYESPPTPFVADFLGRSSTLSGTAVDPGTVRVGDAELAVDDDLRAGEEVTCHVRPDRVSIADPDGESERRGGGDLCGRVVGVVDAGDRYDVTVRVDGGDELLVECRADPPPVDAVVAVEVDPEGVAAFQR